MKKGKIESYINEIVERDGVVFFGLIDPPRDNIEKAIEYAQVFEKGNADIILLGGSIGGAEGDLLDEITKRIKSSVSLPVVLFPGNISGVTKEADALYYMSLMNSQNPYWITGAQSLAAPSLLKSGIECIPTSLLIIEPGEAVGWIGESRPIPYHKPDIAFSYALAGRYLGHRLTILERGSGAPGPASEKMFSMVKKAVDHPVICAGSCRNVKEIRKTIRAGADGIHIASIIEKAENPAKKAKRIIGHAKEAGKEKLKRM